MTEEASLVKPQRKVSIHKARELAKKLPKDHPLRALLEVEDSQMDVEEYVVKLKTWLKLLG